jgi:uncharacterized BrkB/YihY/UPF0761 family membrane protein
MKKYDIGSSLFWLLFSIFICAKSLRLGIGTPESPGMGFMAFGASVILGILSLALILREIFEKEEIKSDFVFSGILWSRLILVLIGLLIYAILVPVTGYLIVTFLLLTFLFWIIERKKVGWILILSFLITIITYYCFSKLLNCQLPSGLLGF